VLVNGNDSDRREDTGQEWLTAAEAAKYLRFASRDALYQAVSRGRVPVRRLGRRLLFRRSELDAVLTRMR
jgi:excisionase family DNA binding protein